MTIPTIRHLLFLCAALSFTQVFGQINLSPSEKAFVDRCDSLMMVHFKLLDSFTADTAELNLYNYEKDSVPYFDEALVRKRLKEMDKKSPFDFRANEVSVAVVQMYVKKRYRLTSRMLGTGQLYFPLFEQKLVAYHLPLELKYLPIVESALNPKAISPSGAGGLWQFMPATGNGYGLEITSMMDERNDPFLATDAACQYLSKLYAIYGDWSMSLAAYNAGQGTVNKAIRRSGGQTDYWSIRSFLPEETQNYVPAFIAVNYVMKYASHHNIYPQLPDFFHFEMDTLHISNRVDFGVVEEWLGYNRVKLGYLNPMYLTEIIPAEANRKLPIKLPVELIGKFMTLEDSIYKYSSLEYKYWVADHKPARKEVIHTVKSGETVHDIAKKYACTEQDIKAWNTITKTSFRAGKKIVVFQLLKAPEGYSPKYDTDAAEQKNLASDEAAKTTSNPVVKKETGTGTTEYIYYVVQKGDTLWGIAKKHNESVEEIKLLNSHLDMSTLHAGTKLKIAKK